MIINSLYKDFNKVSFLQGLQHGLNNNAKFDEFSDEFKTILNYPHLLSNLSFEVTLNHTVIKL